MNVDILAVMPPLLVVILGLFLPVIAFCKICSKAGFPGALGLLMFVPIANIILLFYLAFADWPALRDEFQEENEYIDYR